MYQEIFKQGKIGNITLKNRLVMSPMGTSLAEMDGSPSEDMIAFYEARAIGGAALIIPEIARFIVPPSSLWRSTNVTFMPRSASVLAAIIPHGPPPTTTTLCS